MKRILIYLGILLLVSCTSTKPAVSDTAETVEQAPAAGLDRSQPPAPGPAPEIRLGDYQYFQLENGLKVYVVQNQKIPQVSFSLRIDRDPVLEGDKTGLLSLFGDLMGRGTDSLSKAEIDEAVDFIGARFSTSASGMSGSSLTRHTEQLLGIMREVLLNPTFDSLELDKLKRLAISDLVSSKDDTKYIANVIRDYLVYGGNHPYGEIKTEATIGNLNREDFVRFYQTYWSPASAYLAIVGDIDTDAARSLAQRYFGDWQGPEIPEQNYAKPEPPAATRIVVVDRPTAVQSEIRVGYPVDFKIGDEDFFAGRIMNTILGGGFSSRLTQNIREDKGYTYGVGSGLTYNEVIGRFTVVTFARNAVTDSAVAEILGEMRRMAESGVTEAELVSTKAYMTGGFARTLEDPEVIASFAINTAIHGLPEDFYHNYLKRLNAVTLEEVNAAAQKFLLPDRSVVVVVGKAAEIAGPLSRFGQVEYYDADGNSYDPAGMQKALEGVDAGAVMQRYIGAIGGREALERVQGQRQVWEMSAFGQELRVESLKTAEGLFRVDVESGGQVMQQLIFDGTQIVTRAGGMERPMDDATVEAEILNNRLFPELYYAYSDVELKLEGVEKVGGRDAYVLAIVYPSGKSSLAYFDVESGLKVREATTIDTPQGSFEQAVTYSDYREVDGVRYPFTSVTQMGPQAVESTMTLLENDPLIPEGSFAIE